MLEIAIYIIAVVVAGVACARFIERARAAQEKGLSLDEIRRKRALERMVDNLTV